VAVVGASPNPDALASHTLRNLAGFDGRIHLVNPKYERIGERPCYKSLAQLPEVPDCVIVAVGRDLVEAVVEECARLGVGGVVIYASGFADTGEPQYVELQERLARIARTTGMPIIGPNAVGVVNHVRGFGLSFAPDLVFSRSSPSCIGLVSQSGGVGNGLAQAVHHGTAFSHTLSAGNSCDVDIADYVSYLAHDPDCKSIALIFEGTGDPLRLLEAGEIAWAAGKPLVVFKLARGEQGATAALSHTGFLSGSTAAYRAAFERVGAIMVDSFHALIQTASFFAKAGPPTAQGVAVLGSSGGNLVLAVDEAEAHGVLLPQPTDATREALASVLPAFSSPRNPCDITGGGSMGGRDLMMDAATLLLDDPQYGALLYPWGYVSAQRGRVVGKLGALARARGKTALVVCTAGWLEGPGVAEAEANPDVCLFHSMEACMAAIVAWHAREARRTAQSSREPPRRLANPGAQAAAAILLDAAAGESLTEREAKAVLSLYGVRCVGESLATRAEDAVAAAEALGLPVVLKVESADIPHKSDAGAVRLNLRSADEVAAGFDEVLANARRAHPQASINGVLVQPMIGRGAEVLVGARTDPQFGALIVVGLGGIFVELLQDSVVALAPVSRREALSMLARLRGQAVLKGFRGSAPVDLQALADVIARISELAADHPERIAELDVNPLICTGATITAVDALIVKTPVKRPH
jgi:acyl-CoA synthetase (NDP forming)